MSLGSTMHRCFRDFLLGLVALACSSSRDLGRGPTSDPIAPPSSAPSPASPSAQVAETDDGQPPLAPPDDIDARILAAEKAVADSKFQDVGVIVELSRLELWRDNAKQSRDGATDAERANKNAMRAIAADEGSAAARVALLLSLARSQEGAGATLPDAILELLDVLARTPSIEASSAGAAYKTVEGTIALARGDRMSAKSAFDGAVRIDDGLAAAWAAHGDLSRSDGKFDDAVRAYDKAYGLMPSNPEIGQSLEAAKRGIRLSIPGQHRGPTLPGGDLAPSPPPARACKARDPNQASIALCRALDDLIVAARPAEREAAVLALVQAWTRLQPLCENGDTACGPFVAPALAAASRAYKTAGRSVKSILTARLLLQYASILPESEAVAREMMLELGDRYFWLGQFDEAADFYERYATAAGTVPALPRQKEARERATLIRTALLAWTSTKHWARRASACRAPLCGLRRLVVDGRWSSGRR